MDNEIDSKYILTHMNLSCRMELAAMGKRHVIKHILDKYLKVVTVETMLVMKLGI